MEFPYFFLQVHFSDGLLHPVHTPFLISFPHVLQGSHPQDWHMGTSFLSGQLETGASCCPFQRPMKFSLSLHGNGEFDEMIR